MYVKRIRLENYGPIPNLDIELPFDGDRPKPIVLVGENGSGKSIVLSHIVNGMLEAKHVGLFTRIGARVRASGGWPGSGRDWLHSSRRFGVRRPCA